MWVQNRYSGDQLSLTVKKFPSALHGETVLSLSSTNIC